MTGESWAQAARTLGGVPFCPASASSSTPTSPSGSRFHAEFDADVTAAPPPHSAWDSFANETDVEPRTEYDDDSDASPVLRRRDFHRDQDASGCATHAQTAPRTPTMSDATRATWDETHARIRSY